MSYMHNRRCSFILLFSLLFTLYACDNDSPTSTVFLSGTVTDGATSLHGVSIEVHDLEGRHVASSTTDSTGGFEFKLPHGVELAVRFIADGFTSVHTQYYYMARHVTGINVVLQPVQTTESIIDAAFSGMTLNLADKAWLAVDVLDEQFNEIDGATISVNPSPVQGGTLLCDGSLTGGNITSASPACNPARAGPMYLAYYDAPTNVEVTINNFVSYKSYVRVADVAYVTTHLLPPDPKGFLSITVEAGGRVTTDPDVIQCDGDTSGFGTTTCESVVPHDTSITIKGIVHDGNVFDDWDGCDVETSVGGYPACIVTIRIQQNNYVRAEFDPR